MALTVVERGQRFREKHPGEVQQRKAEWREHMRMNHSCQWCQTVPALPSQTRCQDCVDKGKARRSANEQTWLSLGLCGKCGRYPHLPAMSNNATYRLCEECSLRKTTNNRLGSMRSWKQRRQRLYDQEYQCAYTGTLLILGLILGQNASLDHIYPLHTYPHLKSDPNNTE